MKNIIAIISIFIYLLVSDNQLVAQHTDKYSQSEELGKISWYRNFDEAQKVSNLKEKPIFILFQEVPGCATCRNYGNNILSHPLLVEIIENEFIPLAIFNNKSGHDAKILKKYNEPSWNNPVIRIVNSKGNDVIKRHASDYTLEGLASTIRLALISHSSLKVYVDLITQELQYSEKDLNEAYYSMYCFWTGEAALGQLDGVISTSPGFMNGREVVKLIYNEEELKESEIKNIAKKHKFTFVKDPSTFRMDKDEQYHLKRSIYKYIPLSPIQRTKINSAIAQNQNADIFLSPTQLIWKNGLKPNHNSYDILYADDINKAWDNMKLKKP